MQIETNDTTVNQRVQKLIQALHLKPNSFAESIEKTPTAIYTIINGRNKPGYDILEAILRIYSQVNPGWLLTGEGEMFRTTINQTDTSGRYLQEHLTRLEENFAKLLEQLSVKDHQLESKDHQIEGLQRTVDALISRSANFHKDVAAGRSESRKRRTAQQPVEPVAVAVA